MRLIDIMSEEVETAGRAEDARSALDRMRRKHIHHLVVMEGRRVVGVVSDRDLGGTLAAAPLETRTLAELMVPNPVTASPRTTVREAANLMRRRSIGCLPVLDGGRLLGIVTVTDLLDLIGEGTPRPQDG